MMETQHFWHYVDSKVILFPCAFRGNFTLERVQTYVLGFFCLIVYTRRQKLVIIAETRILPMTEDVAQNTGQIICCLDRIQ